MLESRGEIHQQFKHSIIYCIFFSLGNSGNPVPVHRMSSVCEPQYLILPLCLSPSVLYLVADHVDIDLKIARSNYELVNCKVILFKHLRVNSEMCSSAQCQSQGQPGQTL